MWGRERERKRKEGKETLLSLSFSLFWFKKNSRHRDPGVKPLRVEEAEEQVRGAAVGGGGRGGRDCRRRRHRFSMLSKFFSAAPSLYLSLSLSPLSLLRSRPRAGRDLLLGHSAKRERESGLRPFSFYQSGDIGDDVELKMRCLFGFSSLASPFSESLFER